MYYALFILLLIVLFCTVFSCIRRKKVICRIKCMDKCQKCSLLEELAVPFGYAYHCRCGFFSSTTDAWQKAAGYTWLYDYMAPRFQMVFDALPVYFDYCGRTWLIELWKGQYGINTGAEIGIYHADVELSERHWWLTAFLPGCFSTPSELTLEASICFPNTQMSSAFYEGLLQAGCCREDISIQGLCICVTFCGPVSENFGPLTRFHRWLSQRLNRMYCKLFVWVTRPFVQTQDRVLYLYYFLPSCFRRLLRLHRFHRRCHRKNGCHRPKCCRTCRPRRGD